MTITEVKVAVLIRSGKLTRREILHRFREHQSSKPISRRVIEVFLPGPLFDKWVYLPFLETLE